MEIILAFVVLWAGVFIIDAFWREPPLQRDKTFKEPARPNVFRPQGKFN